jgi:hypothetical protein
MKRFIGGLMVGVVLASGLTAAAQERAAWAYGVGLTSCGSWLQGSRDIMPASQATVMQIVEARDRRAWVLGFISGAGWDERARETRATDAAGIYVSMDKVCASDPTQQIMAAAKVVFSTLQN